MKRFILTLLVAVIAVITMPAWSAGNLLLSDAQGNLVLDNQGRPIPIRWNLDAMPTPGRIPWDMSGLGQPSGVLSLQEIEQAFTASFAAWENVSSANVAFIANCTRCANNDAGAPAGFDGDNLLTFTDPDSDMIFQPGLVALAPSFALLETTTFGNPNADPPEYVDFGGMNGVPDLKAGTYPAGTIIDADIIFNPDVEFVIGAGMKLEPHQQDLQSVATHEIGHFIGLMHSVVGAAVDTFRQRQATMFPFMNADPAVLRTLERDDIASVSTNYPGETFSTLGAISGQVRATGSPAAGVAVLAHRVISATQVDLDAVFVHTGLDGRYTLAGLEAGDYVVSVQPFTSFDGPLAKHRYNALTSQTTLHAFPHEYYNANESHTDDPSAFTVIALTPGQQRTGINILLNELSTIQDRFEINDTFQQAARIEANTIGGHYAVIAPDSDRDFFRFSAGDHRAVLISIDAQSLGSPLDAVAVLRDGQTGDTLAFSDKRVIQVGHNLAIENLDPRIAVEGLPNSDPKTEYVIEIRARAGSPGGPYKLSVRTSDRLSTLLGDVNNDGVVDAADVAAILSAPQRPDLLRQGRWTYHDAFRLMQEWQR